MTNMSNFGKKSIQKLQTITFYIHHQMWVLWQGKHFPIHWMKPCELDWQKLVILEKIYSVEEKISHFIKKYVGRIPGHHNIYSLQRSSILGTAHILRKVL